MGAGVGAVYTGYEIFLTGKFFSIPTFLIVIGSFIIVITFFGCWGALKENYCLILSFSVMLFIIFILELAAGISGYVLRNDAYSLIQTELKSSMSSYSNTTENPTTGLWDDVQRDFNCCGVTNYSDWNTLWDKPDLPLTCCSIPVGTVGTFTCNNATATLNRVKTNGCLPGFSDYIADHAVSLGAAGVVIAVLQVSLPMCNPLNPTYSRSLCSSSASSSLATLRERLRSATESRALCRQFNSLVTASAFSDLCHKCKM